MSAPTSETFAQQLQQLRNDLIEQIRQLAKDSEVDVSQQLLQLETLASRRREEIFQNLTPAQKIQVARHPQRPSCLDYIQLICDSWIELHGDRRGSDDMALVGGVGRIGDQPVLVLGSPAGWTAVPVAAEVIRRVAPLLGLRPVVEPAPLDELTAVSN